MMQGNDGLNEAQFKAKTLLEQPLCILAGAGTGKTRTITHRIAYLIEEKNVPPRQILGVTFTNKAAGEMRERVQELVQMHGPAARLGTFHSMAAYFLRQFGSHIGVDPGFLIYDEGDKKRLMGQIAKDELEIPKDWLSFCARQIDEWQNEGHTPETLPKMEDIHAQKAVDLFASYWKQLLAADALDFNGLLLKWRELLGNPEARKEILKGTRHLLVDEYQDTNRVQADIILSLAKDMDSVAIVGDDDQSIYGWRGACVENMQQFREKLPNVALVRLESNYRSTQTILEAANALIANNSSRIGKTLRSELDKGKPIEIIANDDDRAEAHRVVGRVHDALLSGVSLNEIAILMRTNAQSRPFEDLFRRMGIAYKLIGGTRFYDRREVKDVLAVVRVALNPKSNVDLIRAIKAIPRGIGDQSLKKANFFSQLQETTLLETLSDPSKLTLAKVPGRTQKKIADFVERISTLSARIAPDERGVSIDAEEALAHAADISGILHKLKSDLDPESEERAENIHQLLLAAREFVKEASAEGFSTGIRDFLEQAALMSSTDIKTSLNGDVASVNLMTLHAAKGLEFETVFMVGMEDYGFPHARALEHSAGEHELEEERRLCYVGMTRAKQHLFMCYAKRRMIRGQVQGRVPSRFLREIPGHLVVGDIPQRSYSSSSSYESFEPPRKTSSFSNDMEVELDPEFAPSAGSGVGLSRGDYVHHAGFGRGAVLDVRGHGPMCRVDVAFDLDQKRRTILAKHLRLA